MFVRQQSQTEYETHLQEQLLEEEREIATVLLHKLKSEVVVNSSKGCNVIEMAEKTDHTEEVHFNLLCLYIKIIILLFIFVSYVFVTCLFEFYKYCVFVCLCLCVYDFYLLSRRMN